MLLMSNCASGSRVASTLVCACIGLTARIKRTRSRRVHSTIEDCTRERSCNDRIMSSLKTNISLRYFMCCGWCGVWPPQKHINLQRMFDMYARTRRRARQYSLQYLHSHKCCCGYYLVSAAAHWNGGVWCVLCLVMLCTQSVWLPPQGRLLSDLS